MMRLTWIASSRSVELLLPSTVFPIRRLAQAPVQSQPRGSVASFRDDQAGADGAFAAAFRSEASFNSRDSFSTR